MSEPTVDDLRSEVARLPLSAISKMLNVARCDFQDDGVRGDIGGPCRRLRGHAGNHDPFERIAPDSLRAAFGLSPLDNARMVDRITDRGYEQGYGDAREDTQPLVLAARAVVAAFIDDESGMGRFDPILIDRLAEALDAHDR